MGIFKVVRLGTQAGLAGASVYVANEFKLFGDYGATTGGYANLKEAVNTNEYYKEFAAPVVDQAREGAAASLAPARDYLPNLAGGSARHYWNSGVMAACSGLANLPDTAGHYSAEAYAFIAKQLEAKPEPEKAPESEPEASVEEADKSEAPQVEAEVEESREKCEEPAPAEDSQETVKEVATEQKED